MTTPPAPAPLGRAAVRLAAVMLWAVLGSACGARDAGLSAQAVPPPGAQGLPSGSEIPAQVARDSDLVRVSVVLEPQAGTAREVGLSGSRLERELSGLGAEVRVDPWAAQAGSVEIAAELPAARLSEFLERCASVLQDQERDVPGQAAVVDEDSAAQGRRWLLGGLGTSEVPVAGSEAPWPRWHASLLAPEGARGSAAAAFGTLQRALGRTPHRLSPAARFVEGPAARVRLLDARASLPSELRWMPPAQLSSVAGPQERALELVVVASLARALPGWSFVPASVDLGGRREPAYLYSAADFSTAKARLAALRTALTHPSLAAAKSEVLGERIEFGRAQLANEEFTLRALHGNELARFREDLAALRSLALEVALPPDLGRGGCWSVVGPEHAWRAELSSIAEPESPRPKGPAGGDDLAEPALARLWASLGGIERWRGLGTLHLLGTLSQPDGSRQGVEQWVDLTLGRLALAQAVGSTETLIAATSAEAWIVDGAKGVDLPADQARKFRARGERTWFSVLRRLAQEDRGGLRVAREGERLLLREEARVLCWIELGADGRPARLGYALEAQEAEARYEFADWRLEGALPYPARTFQADRGATFVIEHLEANGRFDASLWVRN